jgi:hypothetical protein
LAGLEIILVVGMLSGDGNRDNPSDGGSRFAARVPDYLDVFYFAERRFNCTRVLYCKYLTSGHDCWHGRKIKGVI